MPLRTFIEEDLDEVALPTVQGLDEHESESSNLVVRNAVADVSITALSGLTAPVRWEDIQPYTTPDQLSEELLTLSLMPRSRWQTLLNLETIKVSYASPEIDRRRADDSLQQRNKPKEAPKAPEAAPFFLPTLPGVDQRYDFSRTEKSAEEKQNRRLDMGSANVETDFVRRLLKEDLDGDCESSRYTDEMNDELTTCDDRSNFLRISESSLALRHRPRIPFPRDATTTHRVPRRSVRSTAFASGFRSGTNFPLLLSEDSRRCAGGECRAEGGDAQGGGGAEDGDGEADGFDALRIGDARVSEIDSDSLRK